MGEENTGWETLVMYPYTFKDSDTAWPVTLSTAGKTQGSCCDIYTKGVPPPPPSPSLETIPIRGVQGKTN